VRSFWQELQNLLNPSNRVRIVTGKSWRSFCFLHELLRGASSKQGKDPDPLLASTKPVLLTSSAALLLPCTSRCRTGGYTAMFEQQELLFEPRTLLKQ
jgi:hypothetical protein